MLIILHCHVLYAVLYVTDCVLPCAVHVLFPSTSYSALYVSYSATILCTVSHISYTTLPPFVLCPYIPSFKLLYSILHFMFSNLCCLILYAVHFLFHTISFWTILCMFPIPNYLILYVVLYISYFIIHNYLHHASVYSTFCMPQVINLCTALYNPFPQWYFAPLVPISTPPYSVYCTVY